MGLFDNKITVAKTIKEIKATDYEYNNFFDSFDFEPYIYKFRNEEILSRVLRRLASYGMDFSLHLNYIANMFTSVCIDVNKAEEKRLFNNLFDLYIENPELFLMNKNFDKVLNAFDDKKIVLEFFRYLSKSENVLENSNSENLSKLIDYVSEARQFFIDDRALLSAAVTLIENFDPLLLKHGDSKDVQRIINNKIEEAKKSCGIYNIDQGVLAEMDSKLSIILNSSQILETLIETAEKQIVILREELKKNQSELTQAKIRELSDLQTKANQILKSFHADYAELQGQQRESILAERDSLVADLHRESEKKKTEIASVGDSIAKRVAIELGRINNVGSESMRRLEEFVSNNDEIKKLLAEAKSNDDFLSRLAQVEKLYELQGIQPVQTVPGVQVAVPEGGSTSFNTEGIVIPTSKEVFVPSILIPTEERVVDPKVCYFFDSNIPFKDRFAELMIKKEEDIKENGSIYHEKFDDIAKMIILSKTPYLTGPSGCGKTYIVEEQFAKLIGLNVVTDSYVTFEQSILGYTNSGNGAYVPSNFYRCYKYGDIYFLDEMDNGIANATLILNKFMGNSRNSFTFPDGITINRHPNFRIVTAGNTKGSGKTLAFNTRQKLDESTMQRMTPVEVGYDNRIEMRILKDYPDWYDFAVNFRKAIEQIPSDSGEEINTIGTFTTRDAEDVKTYLETGAFDDRKIMLYEIVQTKDQDTLSKLAKYMIEQRSNGEFKTKKGAQLLDVFEEVVASKRAKVLRK